MRRPLVLVTAAFILGIIAEDILHLPVWLWLTLCGLAFLAAVYSLFRFKEKVFFTTCFAFVYWGLLGTV